MEGVLSKGRCLILALAIVFFSSSWLLDGLETVNLQDCFAIVRGIEGSVTVAVCTVRSLQSLKQAWGSSTVLWSGPDPCADKWEGILCEDNRVVSLYLVNKELKGTIPPAIGDLTALQNLDLSFNGNLQGTLPDELGKLTSLEYLSIQSCNFSGSIPSTLGTLVNLTFLALNNNNLDGTIPSSVGTLSKLKRFDVAYNKLTGPLPVSTNNPVKIGLDTWPAIEHYHWNDNLFTGNIPPELGNARNCVHMILEFNRFTGQIPESFENLSSLKILLVGNNQLTSPIPSTLNNIVTNGAKGLLQLRAANNRLTGTVPVLSALNQLQLMRFENANLTGPLPADILTYSALQGLYLQNNEIDGTLTIPEILGLNLRYVSLQNNNITGLVQPDPYSAESVLVMLQGNPLCTFTGGFVNISPELCNTTKPTMERAWVSPMVSKNTCQNMICGNRFYLNPLQCRCSKPLVVTLEVRSPSFTNINDPPLWDSFKNQTVTSLKTLTQHETPPLQFESEQLWIRDASLMAMC
uniref:Leucine-rich repeat-containing N-terminal plant-type domain-containing protein n=1 Tax=Physcomitrium patens TaxID=3218 RepID=A0A2K1IK20_PHYPA|nr:hypothetical protein PHYPA_028318 [Physcomitrium patens]